MMRIALLTIIVSGAFGFAPSISSISGVSNSHESQGQSSSSVLEMSFIKNLFSDRSDEEEKASVTNRFLGFNLGKLREDKGNFQELSDEEEDEFEYKYKTEGNFDHLPTKEMTGTDVHITRLCCTVSQQVYDIFKGRMDSYKLSTKEHKTELLIAEDQGIFGATNPNFCACVSGDTLILGWRGTQTLSDALTDVAASPTSSISWRKHGKTIKAQGAMASLADNDIVSYEDFLIGECKKRGIKEIVTTGHSLGGGIAQIAHLILRAQIQDDTSPWSQLDGVNVRSVIFSAPMTTVLTNDFSDETEAFIDELVDNSCNIIFGSDLVPRGYGYLSFIDDFVDDAQEELISTDKIPKILKWRLDLRERLEQVVENVRDSKLIEDLVLSFSSYIHPGNIVYYKDEKAEPKVLVDMGAFYKNTEGRTDTFRSVKYEPTDKPLIESVLYWHGAVKQPGLIYPESALEK